MYKIKNIITEKHASICTICGAGRTKKEIVDGMCGRCKREEVFLE